MLAALSVVSVAVILLWLDLPLALVTLLSFPFLIWLSRWFQHASARAYRRTRETVALVIVHFVESMGGIRAVQAFRREPRNQEIFETRQRGLPRREHGRHAADRDVLAGDQGDRQRDDRGRPDVRRLPASSTGTPRSACWPRSCSTCAGSSSRCRSCRSSTTRCSRPPRRWRSCPGVLDETAGRARAGDAGRRSRPVGGEITFDAVRVRLPRRPAGAGRRSTCTIPAGQTVALVGATGAGKSTIAKLVARFYDPTGGTVRLDGVDLRDLSRRRPAPRRGHGHPGELPVLRHDRGQHRVRSAGRDRRAGRAAARAIGADTFIDALPDGYDTDVRKRGGRLSAGQRQLVAFARAFLADPEVLILDEATSSLDIPSERLVQRALRTILRRPYRDRDRAPAVHGGDRRPGAGARRRPDRRGRHTGGADHRRRSLREPAPAVAGQPGVAPRIGVAV